MKPHPYIYAGLTTAHKPQPQVLLHGGVFYTTQAMHSSGKVACVECGTAQHPTALICNRCNRLLVWMHEKYIPARLTHRPIEDRTAEALNIIEKQLLNKNTAHIVVRKDSTQLKIHRTSTANKIKHIKTI